MGKVERVQNLRRSNAAGPHKVTEPCRHLHSDAWGCHDCGDTWDDWLYDTNEERMGEK